MSGRCAACGRPARQRRRAYVPDGPALVRAALVCSSCFGGAIAVVPGIPSTRCLCGELATVCHGCADRRRATAAGELLAPAIRTLKALRTQHVQALSKAPSRDVVQFLEGKIEALDGAIAILETEAKASEARAVLTMLTTDQAPAPGGDTDAS